jgi:hypothetical protein
MDEKKRRPESGSDRPGKGEVAPELPRQEGESQGLTRRNAMKIMSVVGGSATLAVLPTERVDAANADPPEIRTAENSAAWLKAEILTPKNFGAAPDASADNGHALNAFFAAMANDRSFKYCASGDWATASPLIIDAGTYGRSGEEIDFGNCRIRALSPVSRLVTIQNNFNGKFSGRLHVQGVNHGSDVHTDWKCDVALYCNNIGQAKFDQLLIEGFGYAAVESEKSSNDSVHWGHIAAKRVGSGDAHLSRSLTASWSGPSHSGSYGSVTQFTEFTVDRLPIGYLLTGSSNLPDRTILVEIDGRLFFVTHINAGSRTLRVFPRLAAGMGGTGRLKYHYGGALVLRGTDSNIDTFEQISCVAGSTGLELSCLYGASGGIVHTESCGSNMRVGANPGSVMWGAFIAQRYCDGNNFNYVQITRSASQVFIGASPASAPPSKDIDVSGPLNSANGAEFYSNEGFSGLTLGGPEGWHFRRKRFVDQAKENLDFGNPRTFDNPVFHTGPSGAASFKLVAPENSLRGQFGLDCAQVTIMGPGANGEPRMVEFIPPSGHRINGGKASAPATLTGFTTVARLAIYYDGRTSWTIR